MGAFLMPPYFFQFFHPFFAGNLHQSKPFIDRYVFGKACNANQHTDMSDYIKISEAEPLGIGRSEREKEQQTVAINHNSFE